MATNKKTAEVKPEVQSAVALLEKEYMSISELKDALDLSSYQYARQMVQNDMYGLSATSIEAFGRTYVSRAAVNQAIATRADNKAKKQQVEEPEPAA